jgi:hypothetical protein
MVDLVRANTAPRSASSRVLIVMACIDWKDIPQSLLPDSAALKMRIEAIGTLRAYSFITKRGEATVFDLHRLVHLATRSWLQKYA